MAAALPQAMRIGTADIAIPGQRSSEYATLAMNCYTKLELAKTAKLCASYFSAFTGAGGTMVAITFLAALGLEDSVKATLCTLTGVAGIGVTLTIAILFGKSASKESTLIENLNLTVAELWRLKLLEEQQR